MTRIGVWVGMLLSLVLSLGLASSAWAGNLAWSGPIVVIDNDAGTGAYTGGTPGSTSFSGYVAKWASA